MTHLSDTGLQAAQERFKTLLLGHVSKEVLGEAFRAYLEETGSVVVLAEDVSELKRLRELSATLKMLNGPFDLDIEEYLRFNDQEPQP